VHPNLKKMNPHQFSPFAAAVANARSPAEAFALYKRNFSELVEYRFVLASSSGLAPGFAVNRAFSATACVRSLFNTPKVLVLDAQTVEDMSRGEAKFLIDYSISLDTQAMSYLKPYLDAGSARLPSDMKEVFDFIAQPEVWVDSIPYMTENIEKLTTQHAIDCVYSTLKAYEVLRTLDTEWLTRCGEVRSMLPDSELTTLAQRAVSDLLRDQDDDSRRNAVRHRHRVLYVELLAMVAIQLRHKKLSVERRFDKFLTFCDSELATMPLRELLLARAYFERGHGLRLFHNVQVNARDLLSNLHNMAWDLNHVRQLEHNGCISPRAHTRYFFSALLTFDKGLIEVMDLAPLKALVHKIGESSVTPFFADSAVSKLYFDDESRDNFERYFTASSTRSRDERRKAAIAGFDKLASSLEIEVLALTRR
jgi:hypothetical protein